jgi:hypothetical protein
VAFGQAKFCRNVADVNIEEAVAVDIPEIHTHSLEGIMPQDAGFGGGEIALTFEQNEFQVARGGAVVQEAVGTEVVGDVKFGQQVAVEVGGDHGQGPAAGDLFAEDIRNFAVVRRGRLATVAACQRNKCL